MSSEIARAAISSEVDRHTTPRCSLDLADPDLLRSQALIGGVWSDADDRRTISIMNPATGAVIGSVPDMGVGETARAIAAANAAWPAWRARTAADRGTILRNLHDLMHIHREDLALILTSEQGKPLAESRSEIAHAAAFIDWFAEEGKRIYGDIVRPNVQGRRILVTKEPIGVFAAITPWNFPSAMITRKAAPAWAAGCTGLIRPASQTPLSALALGVLAMRAGMPPGVCNIVTGDPVAIGSEMTASSIVRKLSFTGSTRIGAQLLAQCAPTIKRTSMELGGNAPFIVFNDADLDLAVEGAMAAKFRNAGQTCVCANRLLVQSGIYDAFVERLATAVGKLKLGNGVDRDVTQGPMIDANAVEKVKHYVEDAMAHGAVCITGGVPHALGGRFFEPTVLSNVSTDALCFREEIFGPLAPVFRFDTEADAIEMANDSEYGLASYVYSRDLTRALRVAEALECGIVGINEGMISTEIAPFGGVKSSGIGREGSRYGIEDYLELKYIGVGAI